MKKLTKKELKFEVESLLFDNRQGEAMYIILKYFNKKLQAKIMKQLNILHGLYGYLLPEIRKLKEGIFNGMW